MNDAEQHLRGTLSERLDREELRPAPLPAGSRKGIRRRRAALVLAASTVVASGAVAVAALGDRTYGIVHDRDMQVIAPPPRPDSGAKHESVWDGGVRFEFRTMQCGSGPAGDSDTDGIRPDGMHCWTHFAVLNESDDGVLLPWAAQRLVTGAGALAPAEHAMAEIYLDEPGHVFDAPIPPGGGGSGYLVFDVPLGVERRALRFHAEEGSGGATIRLDGCPFFSRSGGSCYVTGYARAELGVAYPHRISGPRGGMPLFTVCFDERQWAVVEPHPTEGMPEDFTGQGVMTLKSPGRAEFKDNSGMLLTLSPTAANEEQPGVCG